MLLQILHFLTELCKVCKAVSIFVIDISLPLSLNTQNTESIFFFSCTIAKPENCSNAFLIVTLGLRLGRKGPVCDHQVPGNMLFLFTFKYLYLGKICSERQPRAELGRAAVEAAWGSTSRWCQNILALSGSQYLRPCRLFHAGPKTGDALMYFGNWVHSWLVKQY